MNIYKSKFLNIDFVEEHSLFEFTWLANSSDMNGDDYRQEMLNYLEKVQNHHPSILLIDDRQMQFIISLELQDWLKDAIFVPVIKLGLKAFAVVMNQDMMTQLATQLSAEENPAPNLLNSRFFDNVENARQWLLEQKP